jgi:hypothetical protein
MYQKKFKYKENKTLFQINQNQVFRDYQDNQYTYDSVYRLVDITGNLISEVDKFDASGYGFGTVVKMSVKHLSQLDKNIQKMVENAQQAKSLDDGLSINANDNLEKMSFEFEEDGIDFVVLVKVVENDAYILVFDSMPNYLNYYFLFAGIHDFNNQDMSIHQVGEEYIEDEENNFYFYYGDENTDSSFSFWLEETAPELYQPLVQLGVVEKNEE